MSVNKLMTFINHNCDRRKKTTHRWTNQITLSILLNLHYIHVYKNIKTGKQYDDPLTGADQRSHLTEKGKVSSFLKNSWEKINVSEESSVLKRKGSPLKFVPHRRKTHNKENTKIKMSLNK